MSECSHCQGILIKGSCVNCGENPENCTCKCSGCNGELTKEGKCKTCSKKPDYCDCGYENYKKTGLLMVKP